MNVTKSWVSSWALQVEPIGFAEATALGYYSISIHIEKNMLETLKDANILLNLKK